MDQNSVYLLHKKRSRRNQSLEYIYLRNRELLRINLTRTRYQVKSGFWISKPNLFGRSFFWLKEIKQ